MLVTELSEFPKNALAELGKLLVEYGKGTYEHPYFCQRGVHGCLNTTSGFIFLSDEDYNVLMINEETDQLEGWYHMPYGGEDGFFSDLVYAYEDDWYEDDKEYLVQLAKDLNRFSELPKSLTDEQE
jgi:hypothetical protein